jgi:cobalt-zinc-cadmium efflux system membrane fusion protein
MKIIYVVLALACALSLAACDTKRFLSGGDSTEGKTAETADVQHDGAFVAVPAASPLRKSLVVGSVEQQAFAQTIDAPGVIEAAPEKLVKITPPLGGRIVRLHRQLGDTVKAGEPLATIDSPDLGSAYSEHVKAQAALLQARQEFERQKALQDEDISARKDFEAAQLALSAAESDVRATSDRLAQLGASTGADSRREYILRSPIAGHVVEMNGSQGGYWNDTTASIMTVADLSTVWLSASVAEKDLAQMFVGQAARIVPNAYASREFDGKVKYIADLLDPDTRTARVRVAIDNRDGLFKPGMFARVSFSGPTHQALLVPAAALLQSGLYTRVFVEQTPFRYESRVVSVGATVGDRVEVLSGLKAGERIVVKDGVLLND